VPFLSYTQGAYLGRMVDVMLTEQPRPVHLAKIFETDMAEVLKMMALAGHGVAFLPESAVRRELKAKTLAQASDMGIEMEIRLIRERPQAGRNAKASTQAFWEYVAKQETQ
jgi:LysR family transcriptional regulator, hypochlorite-specific transcription factor HypT